MSNHNCSLFSLFMEFTISETFSYFGRLLHMTNAQVVLSTYFALLRMGHIRLW